MGTSEAVAPYIRGLIGAAARFGQYEARGLGFLHSSWFLREDSIMSILLDKIRLAVAEDRFVIGWHADERLEERSISDWQVVAGLVDARLVAERQNSQPHASVVVRQLLADGTEIEVVWSWMQPSQRAKLVTVYFPDEFHE